MTTKHIAITINGRRVEADVEPRQLLAQFIRETAGLTGTHIGCDTTSCGVCTVLLDSVPIKSCTLFAVQADGRSVSTVEGMAAAGEMHPLQQAFWDCHGLQCGFCTPGMLMTGVALLARNPDPTEDEIRHAISGNLCRCTGYQNIIKSVQQAAAAMRQAGSAAD